ncbi:unnamed protein product [Sphenostylis stenocarpa]|uniref:Transmembrane protein n=1 Tax=Sphenostylis stenocarpa TaxID=92480 RepID=A0AA86SHN9_9FABA|nr:unnamed protein product [Sphenostylis stenocarpa]
MKRGQLFMASPAFSLNSLFIALVVALFFAVAAAQTSAPAPGPDAGAAGSVSNSFAIIGASIVVSMLAIFKH